MLATILYLNDEKTHVDPRLHNDILWGLKALCGRQCIAWWMVSKTCISFHFCWESKKFLKWFLKYFEINTKISEVIFKYQGLVRVEFSSFAFFLSQCIYYAKCYSWRTCKYSRRLGRPSYLKLANINLALLHSAGRYMSSFSQKKTTSLLLHQWLNKTEKCCRLLKVS